MQQSPKRPAKRGLRIALITLGTIAGIMAIAVLGFVVWALPGAGPEDLPEGMLSSDTRVLVAEQGGYTFLPRDVMPDTGFIFYTGGLVREASYAGIARGLAERGIGVFLPGMPLNLAVLNANAAADIIAANPCIDRWVVAGHSLGGAMAAAFADGNRELVSGLVLLASYPAEANDLSASDIPVLSVYAENDGLASPEEVRSRDGLLPDSTAYMEIPGGNHARFGHYGAQEGDRPAQITREAQQEQTLQAILRFVAGL